MHKAIANLEKAMKGMGDVYNASLRKNKQAMQSVIGESSKLQQATEQIRQRMAALGKQRIKTTQYQNMENGLEESAKKADILREKIKKMDSLGEKPNSKRYQSVVYDYEQAAAAADTYLARMQELEQTGKSHIAGTETEEYRQLEAELRQCEQELQQLNALQGNGTTGNRFSDLKEQVRGIIANAKEAPPLTQQIANGFNSVVGKAQTLKGNISQAFSNGFQRALPSIRTFTNACDGIENALRHPVQTFNILKDKATSLGNNVKTKFSDVGQSIRYAFQNPGQVFEAMKAKAVSAGNSINGVLGKAASVVRQVGSLAAGGLSSAFSRARESASGFARQIGSNALGNIRRAAGAIRTGLSNGLRRAASMGRQLASSVGSKLLSGIKKATSGFKGMGSSAEGVFKKIRRVALTLIGMRSIWAGLRQIVTSALNDNQELKNSLNAVKGVLGEALSPAINALVQLLTKALSFADRIYQIFTGTSLIAQYNAKQAQKQADSMKDTADSAKETKRQLAGFDTLNVLSDSSSSSSNNNSSNNSNEDATFTPVDMSKWDGLIGKMKSFFDDIKQLWKAGDFEGIGDRVAEEFNKFINKAKNLDWDGLRDKINTKVGNIVDIWNGFIRKIDAEGLGNVIGEGITTAISALDTIFTKFDWATSGKKLADLFNGMFDKIDFSLAGKTLSDGITGVLDYINNFLATFKFFDLGKKIGDFLMAIDFKDIANKVMTGLGNALTGAFNLLSGFLQNMNWGDILNNIEDGIYEWFRGDGPEKLTEGLFELLGSLVGNLISGFITRVTKMITDMINIGQIIHDYFADEIDAAGGNVIEGIFNGMVKWLKDVGNWIYEHILKPFVDGFKKAFDIHSPSKNPDIIELGKNIIIGAFSGIIDWMKGIGDWLQTNVFDKLTAAWGKIKQKGLEIAVGIKDTFSAGWNKIKDTWNSIKDSEAVKSIKNAIGTGWENAKTTWNSIKAGTEDATKRIWGAFTDSWHTAKNGWNSIKEGVSNATKQLLGKYHDSWKKASNAWTSIKNGNVLKTLKGKYHDSWKKASNAWKSIKDKAATVTMSLKDKLTSAIKNAINTMIGGINKVIGWINKIPGVNIGTIPKLAKGGLVNRPGTGVHAIVGEAGPEAVIPLNRQTLSTLAGLLFGYLKTSLVGAVTSAVEAISSVAANSKNTITTINAGVVAGLDRIDSSISNGLSDISTKLQAIANNVNYRIPVAVNIVPYNAEVVFDKITSAFKLSNEDLISVLIQLFGNQTSDIVAALKALKLIVNFDSKQQVDSVIEEIKRRQKVSGGGII